MAKLKKGQVVKYTFHSAIETKTADDKARTLVVRISTKNPDRSNDIVEPRGVVLDNYMRNPVVALSHNYKDLPIARAKDIQITDDGITATVEFPAEGTYDKADTVYKLYKEGFMNAWSIGFMPSEYSERKDENGYGYTFTKWELLEFSAVLVPDNPEALTIMRSKGIEAKEVGKEVELKAPDDGTGEGNSEGEDDDTDNADEVPEDMNVMDMSASHLKKVTKSAATSAINDYYGTADEDFDTGKGANPAVVKVGAEFSQENLQTIQKAISGMRKHAAAVNAHADMLEKMIDPTNDDTDETEADPAIPSAEDADESENPNDGDDKSLKFRLVEKKTPATINLNLVDVIKAIDKMAGVALKDVNKAK